jgi:adenosylhomocysteine nucleosidase
LHVFDIVVGDKTVDYSAFKSDHADAGAGIDPAHWAPLYHRINGIQYRGFPGDAGLASVAEKTPYAKGKVIHGVIGSGFQYNRELDHLVWLHRTYGTDAEDMESVYVAGVAAGMQIPFLAIRILSDSEWNHPQLERSAGDYCAQFVAEVVRRLARAPSTTR